MPTVDFEELLRNAALPRQLGDVRLHYEPSLLVGQTERKRAGPGPALSLLAGALAALGSAAVLFRSGSLWGALALGWLAAAGVGTAFWFEARARRRRRFVADFFSQRLRLEFTTPARGLPRTLYVPFERVRSVDLLEHGEGYFALTVDFAPRAGSELLWREVLVAFGGKEESQAGLRLCRLLRGAFGLPLTP